MSTLRFYLISVVQTLLRVLPFPTRTGLVKIGNPGRDAPVLLTGNFGLTVARVRRALRGIDAYLLVANSRGINVWCASAGGHLTNHDVISVLKTSGIAERVDHRQVILPQLAATGIEGGVIQRKTGWHVVWGPVYARAIPQFLGAQLHKTSPMRVVRFGWRQRLEMAVAWAFPMSLLALIALPFWRAGALPLAVSVWVAPVVIFLAFPLYAARLRRRTVHVGFVFFDFGRHGVPLILWSLFIAGYVGYTVFAGEFSWGALARWGVSALAVLLILALDLTGSTPTYKSGLHPDRLLRIELDPEKCKGAGLCEQVCPVGVFAIDHENRRATLPRAEYCVQCGACIVQCPCDALHFSAPDGGIVPPDTIRRFKLNMMGSRTVVTRQPEKPE